MNANILDSRTPRHFDILLNLFQWPLGSSFCATLNFFSLAAAHSLHEQLKTVPISSSQFRWNETFSRQSIVFLKKSVLSHTKKRACDWNEWLRDAGAQYTILFIRLKTGRAIATLLCFELECTTCYVRALVCGRGSARACVCPSASVLLRPLTIAATRSLGRASDRDAREPVCSPKAFTKHNDRARTKRNPSPFSFALRLLILSAFGFYFLPFHGVRRIVRKALDANGHQIVVPLLLRAALRLLRLLRSRGAVGELRGCCNVHTVPFGALFLLRLIVAELREEKCDSGRLSYLKEAVERELFPNGARARRRAALAALETIYYVLHSKAEVLGALSLFDGRDDAFRSINYSSEANSRLLFSLRRRLRQLSRRQRHQTAF